MMRHIVYGITVVVLVAFVSNVEAAGLNDPCAIQTDCDSGLYCDTELSQCASEKTSGESCMADYECASTSCYIGDNTCRPAGYGVGDNSVVNGDACAATNDCALASYCTASDGSGTCVPDGANEASCGADNECTSGFCYPGDNTCRPGGYCGDNNDCTGSDICLSSNTCGEVDLANGQNCVDNEQCANNNCYSSFCRPTGYGASNNTVVNGDACLDTDDCALASYCTASDGSGTCAADGANEASCGADNECTSGFCYPGDNTCRPGDYCGDNNDCTGSDICLSSNTCGEVDLADGQSCVDNEQCANNNCNAGTCRPDGYCTLDSDCDGNGGTDVCLSTNNCALGNLTLSASCIQHKQCISDQCTNGKCSNCLSHGECPDSQHCSSYICQDDLPLWEPCASELVCASGRCQTAYYGCAPALKSTPIGDVCYEGSHCVNSCTEERNLVNGTYVAGTCVECTADNHCSGSDICLSDYTCGEVDLANGQNCVDNEQCANNNCYSSICRPTGYGASNNTVVNGDACLDTDDCALASYCTASDGSGTCVADGANEASCGADNECTSGFCYLGDNTCRPGDYCGDSDDCTGNNGDDICLSTNTCGEVDLANGQNCVDNEQCANSNCYSSTCRPTGYGASNNTVANDDACLDTDDCAVASYCTASDGSGVCVADGANEVPCGADNECTSGFCYPGDNTCRPGDYCGDSDDCTGNNGDDICLSTNTCGEVDLANGQNCVDNEQCANSNCYSSTCRPTGYGASNNTVVNGDACLDTNDCALASHCTTDDGSGTCEADHANGDACSADNECTSSNCFAGFCEPAGHGLEGGDVDINGACHTDADCISGNCFSEFCKPVGYGEQWGNLTLSSACNAGNDCASTNCYANTCEPDGYGEGNFAVAYGDACVSNNDCANSAVCDGTYDICVTSDFGTSNGGVADDLPCKTTADCGASSYCTAQDGSGVCATDQAIGASCSADNECVSDVCDTTCKDCRVHSACPDDEWCDAGTLMCETDYTFGNPCTSDAQCVQHNCYNDECRNAGYGLSGGNITIGTGNDHTCLYDADCVSGGYCLGSDGTEGHCVGCEQHAHCGEGNFCNNVNSCQPSTGTNVCSTGDDCATNTYCNSGICADVVSGSVCSSDRNCGFGEICSGGTCTAVTQPGQACSTHGNCKDGQYCGNGDFCIDDTFGTSQQCLYNGNCAAGQRCINWECTSIWSSNTARTTNPGTSCSYNGNCGAGTICQAGTCQPQTTATAACIWNGNCAHNEVCENGFCIASERFEDNCEHDSNCFTGETCRSDSNRVDGLLQKTCYKACTTHADCASHAASGAPLGCMNGFCRVDKKRLVCKGTSCVFKSTSEL